MIAFPNRDRDIDSKKQLPVLFCLKTLFLFCLSFFILFGIEQKGMTFDHEKKSRGQN